MKKTFRKNQLVITGLALLIAIAGYFSFTGRNADLTSRATGNTAENKDDLEVSIPLDDDIKSGELDDSVMEGKEDGVKMANAAEDNTEISSEIGTEISSEISTEDSIGEAVLTSGNSLQNGDGTNTAKSAANFMAEAKLNREQMRAKEKESLMGIVNNANLSEDAKKDAVNEMLQMTKNMEKENSAQEQLGAKGFSNAVVNIGEKSVDVIIGKEKITDVEKAQIEDVVSRKTGCKISDIVITTMK